MEIKDKTQKKLLFAVILAAGLIILAVPCLFIEIESDFNILVVLLLLDALAAACAFSGTLKDADPKLRERLSFFIWVASPFMTSILIAPSSDLQFFLINTCIILIPYLLLFIIFKNSKVCVTVTAVICFLLNTLNQTLIIIRGTPLTLSDFAAFGTAMTVASNYSYKINQETYYSFLCTFFVIAYTFIFPFRLKNTENDKLKKFSLGASAIAFVCSVSGVVFELVQYDLVYDWYTQNMLYSRGVCYNLVMNLKDGFLNEPENYTQNSAEDILERYSADESGSMPNIIVIMNESFADISQAADLDLSEDVMPFVHSLDENVTKGKLVVPSFGGGTCNSEFEFLTGLSMAFLPQNSYPYLQYINSDINTLNSSLDSDIYDKIYMHPYIASNWKRSSVFTFLGFDEFYDGLKFSSQESYSDEIETRISDVEYDGVETVRQYIGDGVTYDKVIELYENKPEDKKIIQFVVTMQNHSPYNYDGEDFENTVSSGTGCSSLDQYLSLIKISDSEIQRLVEYFSSADEDTVIVFFGDHLPAADRIGTESDFTYKTNDTLELYSTPFFIWTNFETETEYVDYVSLNYLSLLMKKKAGIPLTQFDRFREELYSRYPIFSTNIIIDSDGNSYLNYNGIDDALITDYEYLQHYYLFDN